MKKYRVTVNGIVYEIELEEIQTGENAPAPAPAAVAPAPVQKVSPEYSAPAAPARKSAPAVPAPKPAAPAPRPAAPAPRPAAPAPRPAHAAVPGGERIEAPLPGNILAVNISVGSRVQRGQVLMILEAMKMENEIMCPRDGEVVSVNTEKGASVDTGALLCVIA